MKKEEIRNKVDELYKIIEDARIELKIIRVEKCEHTEFKIGNYGCAPGHFALAKICTTCDEYLSLAEEDNQQNYI